MPYPRPSQGTGPRVEKVRVGLDLPGFGGENREDDPAALTRAEFLRLINVHTDGETPFVRPGLEKANTTVMSGSVVGIIDTSQGAGRAMNNYGVGGGIRLVVPTDFGQASYVPSGADFVTVPFDATMRLLNGSIQVPSPTDPSALLVFLNELTLASAATKKWHIGMADGSHEPFIAVSHAETTNGPLCSAMCFGTDGALYIGVTDTALGVTIYKLVGGVLSVSLAGASPAGYYYCATMTAFGDGVASLIWGSTVASIFRVLASGAWTSPALPAGYTKVLVAPVGYGQAWVEQAAVVGSKLLISGQDAVTVTNIAFLSWNGTTLAVERAGYQVIAPIVLGIIDGVMWFNAFLTGSPNRSYLCKYDGTTWYDTVGGNAIKQLPPSHVVRWMVDWDGEIYILMYSGGGFGSSVLWRTTNRDVAGTWTAVLTPPDPVIAYLTPVALR